jgi:hypothetical protein
MRSDINKMRADIEDKDKKIRELTIRLEARKQNKFGKDMEF